MRTHFVLSFVVTSSMLLSSAVMAADPHYLTPDAVANSQAILPPPPTFDSVSFLRDKAIYDWGLAQRKTPRGEQAAKDADIRPENIPSLFSEAFGYPLEEAKAPEIYKLIITMKEDAGDYATAAAKKYYNRVRPFSFFNTGTCRPEDEKTLSTNGSYPSGHTTIGWAIALVLAEINPAKQDAILKRGLDIGESRVICGYHWQSDVDAARIVAGGVVATLHTNDAFAAQLVKAKQEFKALSSAKTP